MNVAEIDPGHVAQLVSKRQRHEIVALRVEANLNYVTAALRVENQIDEAGRRRGMRECRLEVAINIADSEQERCRAARFQRLLQRSLDHLVEIRIVAVERLAIADDRLFLGVVEFPAHASRLAK